MFKMKFFLSFIFRFLLPLRAACCWTRRKCFQAEAGILQWLQRHREKFVFYVHHIWAIFILFLIGVIFVYELWYVLPMLADTQGIWHKLNWLLGIYIVFNILGNWWLAFESNTSVESLSLKRQLPEPGEAHLWHYCPTCQKFVPPRSWHCRLCNTCILKRDHHCIITGNCIGHNNQRYFLAFLFHLTFGCGVALVYNVMLSWKNNAFIVAEPILVVGQDYSQDPDLNWKILIATLVKLNFFLFMVPLLMFVFQMVMVHRNSSCYMMLDRSYDVGWRRNFDIVLGKRRFWVFLSPTVASPLPNDGAQWIQKQFV
ncbi:probable palmitoyltransferase ZDHHC24 [Drosophila eugracilis]|uniref:probable palmitoyltransferase ZDHHC24 n=1 Tax=Drosophila eugracilis TaxID=29029 RepID=UPI001BD93C63|nr:probable palmitoyltransferase ZDHHC24 [Drosophila eugracilis]